MKMFKFVVVIFFVFVVVIGSLVGFVFVDFNGDEVCFGSWVEQ